MTLSTDILEERYAEFVAFILRTNAEYFKAFVSSPYLEREENYKHSISSEARAVIRDSRWKEEDIGTGRIQSTIKQAIQTKVLHRGFVHENNLVDWRQKDDFARRLPSRSLEQTLFNFYKNKESDSVCFDEMRTEGLPYQFMAYLFFLKDDKRYLPISQKKFDEAFKLLGVPEFETSGNASWENYSTYCSLIKEVRDYLISKDSRVTLIDAHSFVWILVNQMIGASGEGEDKEKNGGGRSGGGTSAGIGGAANSAPVASSLTVGQWKAILLDEEVTDAKHISLFEALLHRHNFEANSTELALELGYQEVGPLNLEVGRYAKRIAESAPLTFGVRNDGSKRYWDLFFEGREEGHLFYWKLKAEIVGALVQIGLTSDISSPDQLPGDGGSGLFEGMKRTIVVNAYERNPKARVLCLRHWKAICSVCDFDFEKRYGELGKGFIHVHHLTPVSLIRETYEVNPINDLRPVCPNCHAMIHRSEPALTIEQLTRIIHEARIRKRIVVQWTAC
jgi:5-methylcytosine-specific restriction protein A